MKIDRQFVQELAEGMHSEYDSVHGEIRMVAQRIIGEDLMESFSKFCLMQNGSMYIHPADVFDTFADFGAHGAELRIRCSSEVHPCRIKQVLGMTAMDTLRKLFMEIVFDEGLMWELNRQVFTVAGEKGRFRFNPSLFHYCFAKGRISVRELLDMSRVA